ncbi:MAG: sialate O-acetylesterase [Phycisphaerales bacterium]
MGTGRDRRGGGTEQADRYGENLANLIATLRDSLGVPDLPFVYNRLNIGTNYPYEGAVRAGQEGCRKMFQAFRWSMDDIELSSDLHHYGVLSKVELGYRLADAMMGLIGTIPGDLNGDGFVGVEDLNLVLGAWNQTSPPIASDPTHDDFVGIADLNIVLGNWNTGTPPSGNSPSVPEPATISLFCLAAGLVGARRR